MGYSAVVLEKMSIQLLTWAMRATGKLEKHGFHLRTHSGSLPHHMTINLGKFDLTLNHTNILNSEYAELHIDALFWSKKLGASAFRVATARAFYNGGGFHKINTINDKNSKPHITVALMDGVKPVRSNDLFGDNPPDDLKFYEFNDMLIVQGSIVEVNQ
jgi:hypothetical protein